MRAPPDADPDHVLERLLIVESEALAIAADARRTRRQVARDMRARRETRAELITAELAHRAEVRRDEVRAWRAYLRVRVGLLARLLRWLTARRD